MLWLRDQVFVVGQKITALSKSTARTPTGTTCSLFTDKPSSPTPGSNGTRTTSNPVVSPWTRTGSWGPGGQLMTEIHRLSTDFDGVRVPFELGVGDEGLSVKSEQVVPVGVLAVDLEAP